MTEEEDGTALSKLSLVLCMSGGLDSGSYAKNSSFQYMMNMSYVPSFRQTLQKLVLPRTGGGPLVVADLGCSSGYNTINLVSKVVQHLKDLYLSRGQEPPESQCCFSDLPSNEFNTLFQLIASSPRDFLVSSVPGSFFGRLLPRASVTVFTCTHTIHWISQIPPSILDPESPAYNGDGIWTNNCSLDTLREFKQQVMTDLRSFLRPRTAELQVGGVLFAILAGETDDEASLENTEPGQVLRIAMTLLDSTLKQLVAEEVITREQYASINIPVCYLTHSEVASALEEFSQEFCVEKFITERVVLSPRSGPERAKGYVSAKTAAAVLLGPEGGRPLVGKAGEVISTQSRRVHTLPRLSLANPQPQVIQLMDFLVIHQLLEVGEQELHLLLKQILNPNLKSLRPFLLGSLVGRRKVTVTWGVLFETTSVINVQSLYKLSK